jgi:hypothetical protein
MRVLIGCEFSGVVREAFRRRGFDAYSCDLLPAADNSKYHIVADVRTILDEGWELGIFHPPCTRLTVSGVRWLHKPPKGRTVASMWEELQEGADLFSACLNAPIPHIAVENPVMHRHAKMLIKGFFKPTQTIQPNMFGEPYFKATQLWLKNLPPLRATNQLDVPKKGTEEYKKWSYIHRMSPSKDRGKLRSITFAGIAEAMAEQWGSVLNV